MSHSRPPDPPSPLLEPVLPVPEEEEISLLDIGVILAQHRRLIGLVIAGFTALGLVIAVLSSAEYTSSAQVVPEAAAEGSLPGAGALAALRGFGLSLGGMSTGLSPEAYPSIVQSREVLLAVARDTFFFAELGRETTFVDYVRETKSWLGRAMSFVLGLPGKLVRAIQGGAPALMIRDEAGGIQFLTEEEDAALKVLAGLVSTSHDLETGLMTISVTTEDPLLSAELARTFVQQLSKRVHTVRTQKARENLAFIEQQFAEAEQQLRAAEEALAQFDDRNTNPQTARLRTERDRLQRQVTFASQLYGDLQAQRTQAQIELQRSEPVVTVLQQPAVPLEPSGPNRKLIVLLALILGTMLGVAMAFVSAAIERQSADEAEQRKLEEIKAAFLPKRWRNGQGRAARPAPEAETEASTAPPDSR